MAGAGGKEVGRVSIRVVPDLDKFREELKAALDKAEERVVKIKVDADLTQFNEKMAALKDYEVSAKVKADTDAYKAKTERDIRDLDAAVEIAPKTDKLTKGIEKASKKAKAEVETEPVLKLDRFQQRYLAKIQKAISEFEVNIPLTVDGEQIRRDIEAEGRNLSKAITLLDIKGDIEDVAELRLEVNRFYDKLARKGAENKLLNSDNGDAVKRAMKSIQDFNNDDINTLLKWDEFRKQSEKAKADSDKLWQDFDIKVGIKVDGEGEKAVITRLSRFRRERITIPVEFQDKFDYGGGTFRGLATSVARLKVAFGSAFSVADNGFSKIGALFSKFSPESLIQGGLIVAAVAGLAAPAVALLSGALLTLPAALAGIATPIAVVALGMDGIKKAAEVAKPAFEDLKKTISDTFSNPETGMVKGFQQIADRLIPGLKLPLQGVAESLSTAFNGVIDQLASAGTLQNLQRTIDNIGASIKGATPGLQSFTNGLTNLVAGVSAKFPDLAQSFNNVGKDFDNWIAKITSNGQLDTALDTLKGALSEIGGTIKDIAQWGFENLADPAMGGKIKEFAADLRSIVSNLLPLLRDGFKTVADIVSGIADTFKVIRDSANFFGGLVDKFDQLTGAAKGQNTNDYQGFFDLFGKDGVLGDKAPFRSWFSDAAPAAQEAGQKAKAGFDQAWVGGGGDITAAIQKQLGQITTATGEAQKAALKSVFSGTGDAGVGDAVKNQLSGQINAVLAEAQNLVSTVGPQLQTALDEAIKPVSELPVKIGQSFGVAAASIIGAFGPVLEQVRIGADGIGDALSSGLGNLYQRVYAAFAGVAGAVVAGMSVAGQAAASGVTTILQAVQAGLAALPGVVQAWFGAVPAVIQGAMGQAVGTVANVCGQIVQTMLSYAGAAEQAGVAIGASFAKGLANQTGLVASSASALMSAAKAFFPQSPAKTGPFSGSGWVDKSGEAIGVSFAQGIKDSGGSVVSTARELMQAIKDVFGDTKNINLNFNFGGGSGFGGFAGALPSVNSGLSGLQSSFDSLAPSVEGFQQQVDAAGGALTNLNPAESKARIKELTQSLAELEIQRKTAEAARNAPGADQTAIKAQLEQIRNQKNLLGLERDKLNYAAKYGGVVDDTKNGYGDLVKKASEMPVDFGKAVGGQFMSDLGFSGGGLLTQALDYGTQFVFNVSNMDDALAGQRSLQNKQSLTTLGR